MICMVKYYYVDVLDENFKLVVDYTGIVCFMNLRIQSSISIFYEADFPRAKMVSAIILKIAGFAAVSIIGFDHVVEVGDLVVSMRHLGFYTQVDAWLKTKV